jgi:hypothetical protein
MKQPAEEILCPYCGLKALPVEETGRNENTVYRAGEPLNRIRVRQCDLEHIWWEHVYFSPEPDAKAS